MEKEYSDKKSYKVMNSLLENDYFSQNDGTFVSDEKACKSGTTLYFYGDGKITNDIDYSHQSENILYLKCVTIKTVDHINKRVNYTIGSDTTINTYDLYDLKAPNTDDLNKKNYLKNKIDEFFMVKLELFNDYKEIYMKNDGCMKNNDLDDNLLRKQYYYEHINEYLLYKDQTEFIEYLIQNTYPKMSL